VFHIQHYNWEVLKFKTLLITLEFAAGFLHHSMSRISIWLIRHCANTFMKWARHHSQVGLVTVVVLLRLIYHKCFVCLESHGFNVATTYPA